jgi:hypothetical protein
MNRALAIIALAIPRVRLRTSERAQRIAPLFPWCASGLPQPVLGAFTSQPQNEGAASELTRAQKIAGMEPNLEQKNFLTGWGSSTVPERVGKARTGRSRRVHMNRLIATTAVALLLGLASAFAAENSAPPTGAGVSPEAANKATQPESGSADTSGGAAEQSSAPPSSGAATANKSSESQSSDTSSGAKEQSSAPPDSSAAETSKPNPTIGSDSSDTSQPESRSNSSTE